MFILPAGANDASHGQEPGVQADQKEQHCHGVTVLEGPGLVCHAVVESAAWIAVLPAWGHGCAGPC